MPRSSTHSTLARQWELLRSLPSRPPGKTARELTESLDAAGHTVTKRTVERDLSELSGLFPLMCNDISTPFGWYWRPGAQFPVPGMDLAEAVSLGLLEDVLRQLVPPCFFETLESRFEQARQKLSKLSGNRYSRWTDLVRYVPPSLPLLPPEIPAPVIRTVQDALLDCRQLRVRYVSAGAEQESDYTLHPLALVQQGVRSYLLATLPTDGKPRWFALHRIREAELLDDDAPIPPGFSLDQFLAEGKGQFGAGERIQLKARISETLATLLTETPLSTDQKITTRAGVTRVSATVIDTWQLRFWLLSQGPAITVLQPGYLRDEISGQLKAALSGYSEPPSH
jgi:predicted DNA-binding transcriptional regulator YafY